MRELTIDKIPDTLDFACIVCGGIESNLIPSPVIVGNLLQGFLLTCSGKCTDQVNQGMVNISPAPSKN